MNTLYFVTGNKGKMKEAEEILQIPLEILDIELDEIQSLDSGVIVGHKVKQAYEKVQKPVFVEDVSVQLHTWNGFPGPFIKFILKSGGNSLLLQMLSSEKNREATATCTIGYYDGSSTHIFTGEMNGTISLEEKGSNGFGWDSVFIPQGYTKTLAELSSEEKNNISSRKKSLEQLKTFLAKNF